jgi:hypothetical protein
MSALPVSSRAGELLAVDAVFALSVAGSRDSAYHIGQSVTADAVYSQAGHQHGVFSVV